MYQLGLAALNANQPELARQAFERAVGLRPGFAGAWLDLALATARSGDTAAAVEHLEYLRSQFVLPPQLAAQVDYWFNLWQPSPPVAVTAGWHAEVSVGVGYDSNANTGLARQQIPLSLATGNTLFDVDKALQPRADRFSLVGISIGGPAQTLGTVRMSPVLMLRSKQFNTEGEFRATDLQAGLVFQRPAGADGLDGNWQSSLFGQSYRLGGQAVYNGLRLALQRSKGWLHCDATVGSEVETRRHQRVASLGGTVYSVNAGLACPWPGGVQKGSPKGVVSATLKAAHEQAQLDRPGGNNRSTELSVRYDQPLNATQSLQASWQVGRTADQSGYSPLLESNAARRLQRQTLSLGLRQKLTTAWEARFNVEYFHQRANLPLFELQGSLMMVGLTWRFD